SFLNSSFRTFMAKSSSLLVEITSGFKNSEIWQKGENELRDNVNAHTHFQYCRNYFYRFSL
ncbi:MAG TPA: hypothetical protein PLF20_05830, partial [Bacteroidales bacterium]|nr:hypothetical protein [Bacteroidales bacterium]